MASKPLKEKMRDTNKTKINIKQIANRLKKMRQFLMLSQEEVAICLNITEENYNRMERGLAIISSDLINKLEEVGFDIGYILTGVSSVDDNIKRALEVMPDNEYDEIYNNTIIDGLFNESFISDRDKIYEIGKIVDALAELAHYGAEHYKNIKLRNVVEIRFMTWIIEEEAEMRGERAINLNA